MILHSNMYLSAMTDFESSCEDNPSNASKKYEYLYVQECSTTQSNSRGRVEELEVRRTQSCSLSLRHVELPIEDLVVLEALVGSRSSWQQFEHLSKQPERIDSNTSALWNESG